MPTVPPEFAPFVDTIAQIIVLGVLLGLAGAILNRFLGKVVGDFLQTVFVTPLLLCLMGYLFGGLFGLALISEPDMVVRAGRAEGWATAGLVMTAIASTVLEVFLAGNRHAIGNPNEWADHRVAKLGQHVGHHHADKLLILDQQNAPGRTWRRRWPALAVPRRAACLFRS